MKSKNQKFTEIFHFLGPFIILLILTGCSKKDPSFDEKSPDHTSRSSIYTKYGEPDNSIQKAIWELEDRLNDDPSTALELFSSNFLNAIDRDYWIAAITESVMSDLSTHILYMAIEENQAYCVLKAEYTTKNANQTAHAVIFLTKVEKEWKIENFPFPNCHVPDWPQGFPKWRS